MRGALLRAGAAGFAAAAMAAGLSACGGSGGGPAVINWYIFPEASGSFAAAAKDCSAASGGRYNIVLNTLPSDSDSQRTQLVRRLAAKDSGSTSSAWT